jgi:hypothetical protein
MVAHWLHTFYLGHTIKITLKTELLRARKVITNHRNT